MIFDKFKKIKFKRNKCSKCQKKYPIDKLWRISFIKFDQTNSRIKLCDKCLQKCGFFVPTPASIEYTGKKMIVPIC